MAFTVYVKVKASLTGRGGPRGSGSVKAPNHLDVRHYKGDRSSAIRTGRPYPKRNPWYSFSEAESTPGNMVLSEPRKKSPVTSPGMDPGTVRLVAQFLNHYATPGPLNYLNFHLSTLNIIYTGIPKKLQMFTSYAGLLPSQCS